MKINFDANYQEVSKILRRVCTNSSQDLQPSNQFSMALKDILQEDNNISKKAQQNPDIKIVTSTIMQDDSNENANIPRIKLEDFQLANDNEIQSPSESYIATNDDYKEKDEVKIPTVISVKRIPSDNNLSSNIFNIKNEFQGNTNNDLKINLGKIDKEIISKVIKEEGKKQGIDPALALAVAKTESSMNPLAVSTDGHESKGLFQLLDSTGKELMANFVHYESYNPYDVEQNTSLGVNYLRKLHGTFSESNKLSNNKSTTQAINSESLEKFAVAAFNAGEGRVASAQKKAFNDGLDPRIYENVETYLPNITQNYVKRVMIARKEFSKDV